jgi:hypothetical protein
MANQHLEAEASTKEGRAPEAEDVATTEEASHPEAGGGPAATGRTNDYRSRPTQQPLYLKMLPVLFFNKQKYVALSKSYNCLALCLCKYFGMFNLKESLKNVGPP